MKTMIDNTCHLCGESNWQVEGLYFHCGNCSDRCQTMHRVEDTTLVCPAGHVASSHHTYKAGTGRTIEWHVMGDPRSEVEVCGDCADHVEFWARQRKLNAEDHAIVEKARKSGLRYRAECQCGWHGQWFINGNDANVAEERHYDLVYMNKLPKQFRGRHHDVRIVDNLGRFNY